MRITMYSNYLNHHQLPLCLAMNELLEGKFTFVARKPTPEFRLKLGYEDMNKKYPFVLTLYDDERNKVRANELITESDITIHGSDKLGFQNLRKKTNKPLFIYSERLFKPKDVDNRIIRTYLAYFLHLHLHKNAFTYVLCSSFYTAFDYGILGAYLGKYFKWAYFPQDYKYDIDELMIKKANHQKPIILWVGRMIDWKHPECAVETMHYLDQKGVDCELRIVGDGPLKEQIEKLIKSYGLQNKIYILGPVSNDEVRKNMEEASVYLFTSDYNEGWGAVLNESMNSGCAVIASHAIGATGFLVQNGKNGIVYPYNDQNELFYWTEQVVRNRSFRESLGKKAYYTITDTWNANQGAQRFLRLCKSLLKHEDLNLYQTGPCSKANRIGNNQQKRIVKKQLEEMRERLEKEHSLG